MQNELLGPPEQRNGGRLLIRHQGRSRAGIQGTCVPIHMPSHPPLGLSGLEREALLTGTSDLTRPSPNNFQLTPPLTPPFPSTGCLVTGQHARPRIQRVCPEHLRNRMAVCRNHWL